MAEDHAQTRQTADAALEAGKAEDALARTEAALASAPGDLELRALRAQALDRLDRGQEADESLADLPPEQRLGPLLRQRAEALRDTRGAGPARDLMRRSVMRAEMPHEKVIGLRSVQDVLGVEVALDMVRHQLSILRGNPRLLLEQARLLNLAGRSGRAEQILHDLLTPPFEAVLQMAAIQLQKGEPDETLDLLARYRELTEDRPYRYVLGGQAALKQGKPAAALDWAERGLALAPALAPLNVLKWDALAGLRRYDEAVESCHAVLAEAPEDIEMHQKAVRFLNRIERFDIAREILVRATDQAPDSVDLALLAGEVAMAEGDARGAQAVLCDFAERHKVDSLFVRTIADATAAAGDLRGAIEVLKAAFTPADSEIRLQLALLRINLGEFSKARSLLDGLPDDNTTHQARAAKLRGDLAFARADFAEALSHQSRAVDLDPHPAMYWEILSRYQGALGQVEAAWESHQKWAHLSSLKDPSGQVSGKALHSNNGQILNEFRLLTTPEDRAMMVADADPAEGLRHFRARLVEEPGNTPCAMAMFQMQRRAGAITRKPPVQRAGETRSAIPRRIVQFWDTPELPEQVAQLAEENIALNPGFEFHRYDEAGGAAYLSEKGEEAALRAYRLSAHAAAKSDILRLAVLFHDGGIYLDADDRCIAPLDDILQPGLDLIGYQEDLTSIGNNFLATAPGDPIFRAALDDAAMAFAQTAGESIWLATGPGAITRAIARLGTDDSGTLRPGIWLMPWFRLRHFVSFHTRMTYKATGGHWYRSLMRPSASAKPTGTTKAPG